MALSKCPTAFSWLCSGAFAQDPDYFTARLSPGAHPQAGSGAIFEIAGKSPGWWEQGGLFENHRRSVDRSFGIYFQALGGGELKVEDLSRLLRIGDLAKQTRETHATLRHWMKESLLDSAETTAVGYQVFDHEMAERAKRNRILQSERRTLAKFGRI